MRSRLRLLEEFAWPINDSNINGDFNDPARPVYHSTNYGAGEYWRVDLGAYPAVDLRGSHRPVNGAMLDTDPPESQCTQNGENRYPENAPPWERTYAATPSKHPRPW